MLLLVTLAMLYIITAAFVKFIQTCTSILTIKSILAAQHSVVIRPTAVRAISTDIIRQTIVQH